MKSVWNLPTIVGGTRIIYNIGFIVIYKSNKWWDEEKINGWSFHQKWCMAGNGTGGWEMGYALDLPLRSPEIAVVANHPSFLNLVDLGKAHNSRPRSCLDFFISHSKRTTHSKKFFSETFTKKVYTHLTDLTVTTVYMYSIVFPIDPHDIPWKSAFFLAQNLNFSPQFSPPGWRKSRGFPPATWVTWAR